MTTTTETGPITMADVRAALGDTDPTKTNAGALQRIIGRGSNATVQKHLEALRLEKNPAPVVAPGAIPKAPSDAVDAMWSAAYSAAQVLTLGRLETVTAERETLSARCEQIGADLSASLAAHDEKDQEMLTMRAAAATALTEAGVQVQTLKDEVQTLKDGTDAAKTALDTLAVDFARFRDDAAKDASLAQRDAQIAAQAAHTAMQQTIDSLNQQVGELRSLLTIQAQAHPAPAAKK